MNRAEGGRSHGYTIVETMIFLAVSGAMFVSAMALINGRQARTEFSTNVRDFESSLQDMANDVANGYYMSATSATNNIGCSSSVGAISDANLPVILYGTGSDQQGRNTGCLFIGKAIQFAPNSDQERYALITLVGRQFKNGLPTYGDSRSYYASGSGVRAIYPVSMSDGTPNAVQLRSIGSNIRVSCVLASDFIGLTPAANQPCSAGSLAGLRPIDTLSFITTFHEIQIDGTEGSGSSQVDLVVSSSTLSYPWPRSVGAAVNSLHGYYDPANSVKNPHGGIYICLQSAGSDQFAIVQIGGQNSNAAVRSTISNGRCI